MLDCKCIQSLINWGGFMNFEEEMMRWSYTRSMGAFKYVLSRGILYLLAFIGLRSIFHIQYEDNFKYIIEVVVTFGWFFIRWRKQEKKYKLWKAV